jgi:hypothetical protein
MTDRKYCEMIANIFWQVEVADYNDCMMRAEEALEKLKEADWKSPEEWNKNEIRWMNIVSGMKKGDPK